MSTLTDREVIERARERAKVWRERGHDLWTLELLDVLESQIENDGYCLMCHHGGNGRTAHHVCCVIGKALALLRQEVGGDEPSEGFGQ